MLHLHVLIYRNGFGDEFPVKIYAESPEVAAQEKEIILKNLPVTEVSFTPQPDGYQSWPGTMEYDPHIGYEIAYLWRDHPEHRLTYRPECCVY
jgi:hypothetical protein